MNIEKDDTCTGLDVNCVDEKKSGSKEPKIYELDKIITIQAIGGEVKIAKVFLDDFTIFFREYFEQYGTDNPVVVFDNADYVYDTCRFLRDGTVPEHRTECLRLLHKWGGDQYHVSLLFKTISDLAFIPDVQLDFFRPHIDDVIRKYATDTRSESVFPIINLDKVKHGLSKLPKHIYDEIVRMFPKT